MYDGQWVAGKMHGKGVFVYPSGNRCVAVLCYARQPLPLTAVRNRYEGEFQNDMKEGFGILQYINGERYEGSWKNNFAHGHGTLLYVDGDKYVGDWAEGKKAGIGELLYVNGDRFHGSWVEDKACGEGILEYANGDAYDGEWQNDQRHGKLHCVSYLTHLLSVLIICLQEKENSFPPPREIFMKACGRMASRTARVYSFYRLEIILWGSGDWAR